ncbi:MAG: hypothetical protein LIP06_08515 [Tannerellaceae bacterium]|nr:hypothetical protein [Tannerellaceae bacterium]
MKNKGWIVLFFFFCLLSCKYKSLGNDEHTHTHTLTTEKADEDQVIPVNPFVIYLDMPGGKVSQEIHKSENQVVEVVFSSGTYHKVEAELFSGDDQANISFTRIFLPDSTSDGPFGRSITYDLPMEGNYRLVIAENKMAGEPWSGDFKIKIALE